MELEQVVEAGRKEALRAAAGDDLQAYCDAFLAARSAKAALKQQLQIAEQELQDTRSQLAAALRKAARRSVEHDGVVLAARRKVCWRTHPRDAARVVALLKRHVPHLVEETVNASSLSAYLRRNQTELDSARPAWWTELARVLERSESEQISVRKSRATSR